MNDKWLDFAIRIQSIAQAGLQYGKDKYDKERYKEYGVVKTFILCKYESGKFADNIETSESGFFDETEIPENLLWKNPQRNR